MPDYNARLRAVQQKMAEQKIDLLFLQRSANLHYLTGIPREEQNFGNTMYPGEWLSGAWVAADRAPILSIPRMLADFHLSVTGYDLRVLSDAADPAGLAGELLDTLGTRADATIALDDRPRASSRPRRSCARCGCSRMPTSWRSCARLARLPRRPSATRCPSCATA
jgi:Xaa-Pro aminopeptidase